MAKTAELRAERLWDANSLAELEAHVFKGCET